MYTEWGQVEEEELINSMDRPQEGIWQGASCMDREHGEVPRDLQSLPNHH